MFVLKEMLPSYHKWRYNSHGVREQIGKNSTGREGLGNFWLLKIFFLSLSWDKGYHTRPQHCFVFPGVQVASSWSWFMLYWTCATRQTCTAGNEGMVARAWCSPGEDMGCCYVKQSHFFQRIHLYWTQSSLISRLWFAFYWLGISPCGERRANEVGMRWCVFLGTYVYIHVIIHSLENTPSVHIALHKSTSSAELIIINKLVCVVLGFISCACTNCSRTFFLSHSI